MNSKSNDKLVLWGHIIVLIIIFLVGFGMIFNVSVNKNNVYSSNETKSIPVDLKEFDYEKKELFNKIQEKNLEPFFKRCFIEKEHYESTCVGDVTIEIAKKNKNNSYCDINVDIYEKGKCENEYNEFHIRSFMTNLNNSFENEECLYDSSCNNYLRDLFMKNSSLSCEYLENQILKDDCYTIYLNHYDYKDISSCSYFETDIFKNFCKDILVEELKNE